MSSALHAQDVLEAMYGAGFRFGKGIVVGLTIVYAASRFVPDVRSPVNVDGSVDRGLWQINSHSHAEIMDWECDDPDAASQHAWQLTAHGTKWGIWYEYTGPDGVGADGPYHDYLPAAYGQVAAFYAKNKYGDAAMIDKIARSASGL